MAALRSGTDLPPAPGERRALAPLDEFRQDLADRFRMLDEIALDDFADLIGVVCEVVPDDRLGFRALILGPNGVRRERCRSGDDGAAKQNRKFHRPTSVDERHGRNVSPPCPGTNVPRGGAASPGTPEGKDPGNPLKGTQTPKRLWNWPGGHPNGRVGAHTPRKSRAKPGGQKAGAISAHLPLRVRISPGGHSAGAFGRHLPSWFLVSPDGQAGGATGSHLPARFRVSPGGQAAGAFGRHLPSRVRVSPGGQAGGATHLPPLIRVSPGGQARAGIGAHAPSRVSAAPGGHAGVLIAGGGVGATRIGTQAPCRSWVSPGAHGKEPTMHWRPSALTYRLLQHVPSAIRA
jgi:hypothetical protein